MMISYLLTFYKYKVFCFWKGNTGKTNKKLYGDANRREEQIQFKDL